MFIGHYGPAFGLKTLCKPVPLWVLFIAVQWLDVVWSVLVLAGIEKAAHRPGLRPEQCPRSLPHAVHAPARRSPAWSSECDRGCSLKQCPEGIVERHRTTG